uniref:serine protease 40-like n=1 Tax=Jaculus jaculus TaxID=51337 RepID=UPI001E1B4580|nr:serine protease 40-like [Jaculus jaculus]
MQGARAQQSGPGGHRACVWTALLVWLSMLPVRAQDAKNEQTIQPSLLPSVSTLPSGPTPTRQSLSKACGKTTFAGKIFGGQKAGPGRWPWQASLLWKGVHICGGVLIDNYWVASAAHCFQRSRRPSDYRVLLGYSQLSNPSNYSRHMTVNKVIVQENYNRFHYQRNDIALLQLHIPVEFNSHILPACIPENTTKVPLDSPCWISGWGMLSEDTFLPAPFHLQEAQVSLIENQRCQEFFQLPDPNRGQPSAVKEDMLCAMDVTNRKSMCRGDSGGPLVCRVNDTWYVEGLASWHSACLYPVTVPSIYTKVSFFSKWIKDHQQATPDPDPSMAPQEEKPPALTGWRSAATVLTPTLLTALLSSQTLLLQLTWYRSLPWAHSSLPSSPSHHAPH